MSTKSTRSKLKSYIPFIIYMIISLCAGAFIGYTRAARDAGQPTILPDYAYQLPLWVSVIIFIIVFFIFVATHELTHFITFKINNIDMRALYIGCILFIKEDGKWHLRLRYNPTTSLGGIAIPDIKSIKQSYDFKEMQTAYVRALIAAPIESLILGLILSSLCITLLFNFSTGYEAFIFNVAVSSIIITILLTFSSLAKNDLVVGDFPAYKLTKTDDFFFGVMYYQYSIFSSNPEKVRNGNGYLRNKLVNLLPEKLALKKTDFITTGILDTLVLEYLTDKDVLDDNTLTYCNYLLDNPDLLLKKTSPEASKILFFHMLYMLNKNGDKNRAIELFNQHKDKLPKNKVFTYYKNQAEHILGISNHDSFLKNRKNMVLNSTIKLFSIFDNVYDDDDKLNGRV